MQLNSTAL